MQTLSALLPLAQAASGQAAPPVQDTLAQLLKIGGPLALFFCAVLLSWILGFWIASKLVALDESRFTNALRVFGLYLLLFVILGIAAGVATPIGAALLSLLTGQGGRVSVGLLMILVSLVVLGLAVYFAFLIPMRVYNIRALRALAFLLLSAVIVNLAGFGLGILFREHVKPWTEAYNQLAKAPTADYRAILRESNRQAQIAALNVAESLASDPGRSFADRQASLTAMYKQLEAMRVALPPGDRDAVALYENRKARYEQLLVELRKDVQASQQQSGRTP